MFISIGKLQGQGIMREGIDVLMEPPTESSPVRFTTVYNIREESESAWDIFCDTVGLKSFFYKEGQLNTEPIPFSPKELIHFQNTLKAYKFSIDSSSPHNVHVTRLKWLISWGYNYLNNGDETVIQLTQ